jgi:hypothetical protein
MKEKVVSISQNTALQRIDTRLHGSDSSNTAAMKTCTVVKRSLNSSHKQVAILNYSSE